jgi:hypothetical protein
MPTFVSHDKAPSLWSAIGALDAFAIPAAVATGATAAVVTATPAPSRRARTRRSSASFGRSDLSASTNASKSGSGDVIEIS